MFVPPCHSIAPAAVLFAQVIQASGQDSSGGHPSIDEKEIARLVWEHAPSVLEARRQLGDAASLADQARLLPNPGLVATWGTIPVGQRNPPEQPFGQVPSYSFGISQLVELGKRGPRRRAAEALREAEGQRLEAAYRESLLAVMESLADQAATTARAAALERLAEGSAESLELQRARAKKGDAAGLEVDRIEVDHLRLLSRITDTHVEREAARRTCALMLGHACPRFEQADRALAFLEAGLTDAPPTADWPRVDDRPDVKAVVFERAAATEAQLLAARSRIPDPTVAVFFTHDQFTAAGNQANSLTVSVALPLPLFDRGQVAERRAERDARLLNSILVARRSGAHAALQAANRQLDLVRARARQLDEQALPRARSVVERMEVAARRGGASWPDVLLARRALEELQLDRVQVATEGHKLLLGLRSAAGMLPHPPRASHRWEER
jgi:cobalt-zinc-cadmium efflux system outer membrane protein